MNFLADVLRVNWPNGIAIATIQTLASDIQAIATALLTVTSLVTSIVLLCSTLKRNKSNETKKHRIPIRDRARLLPNPSKPSNGSAPSESGPD